MEDPVTTLDERFSDPDARPAPWDRTRAALREAQIAWLTTVRADGRPHVTPLVPVWLDGKVHFCTGPTEQKAINLDANPHVVLTVGDDHWDRGLDVVVEGRARRVTDLPTLERLAGAWAKKWDGSWQFSATDEGFDHGDGGVAHVYGVEATKVLAFGKGTYSHTRHLPRSR